MKSNRSIRQNDMAANPTALLSGLFTVLILVVIGLALVPTIIESTREAENATEAQGAGTEAFSSVESLVGLMPILFVVILVVGMIGFFVLRSD